MSILKIALFFISFQVAASNLNVIKYAYGKRGWDGVKYEAANIYPVPSRYPRYQISDAEDVKTKNHINVTLNLSIRKFRDDILATVTLKNNGITSAFIPEIYFSADKMNFIISTDDILLEYLGGQFDYGGDFERNDWIEIPAGEIISFTQILNNNYEFLPGKRLYNISSVEYTVVNEKWFTDNAIDKSLASIITPISTNCTMKDETIYVLSKIRQCVPVFNEKDKLLISLLERIGFYPSGYYFGGDNLFKIRTSEILVKIDGDKVHSSYETNQLR